MAKGRRTESPGVDAQLFYDILLSAGGGAKRRKFGRGAKCEKLL